MHLSIAISRLGASRMRLCLDDSVQHGLDILQELVALQVVLLDVGIQQASDELRAEEEKRLVGFFSKMGIVEGSCIFIH